MPLAAMNVHLDACLLQEEASGSKQSRPAGVQRTLVLSGFAALPAGTSALAAPAPSPPRCPGLKGPSLPPPPQRALAQLSPLKANDGDSLLALAPAAPQGAEICCEADDDAEEAPSLDAGAALAPVTITSFVAGRRAYRTAPAVDAGVQVTLLREADNAHDEWALRVMTSDGSCLGYLPAVLAAHLSPLLDAGALSLTCTLPAGAVAGADAATGDVPPLALEGTAARSLRCREAAALHAGWEAAASASSTSGAASGAAALRNMRTLVSVVLSRSSSLFDARQAALLQTFMERIADDPARLLVHLLLRKGPWFKLTALRYADVPDTAAAAAALAQAGLLTLAGGGEPIEPADAHDALGLCAVLSAAEARAAVADARLHRSGGKGPMTGHVAGAALAAGMRSDDERLRARCTRAWATAAAGAACRLSLPAAAALKRAQLLFFLNPQQDLSRFLLVDLGILRYPAVGSAFTAPHAHTPVFSPDALDAYESALRVADQVEAALEARDDERAAAAAAQSVAALGWADDACATVGDEEQDGHAKPAFLACFSAAHVHAGCCSALVHILERRRSHDAACALLRRLLACRHRPDSRGGWHVRLVTDLEHCGRFEEALTAAQVGHADGWTRPGDAHALRAKALRLAKPPRRWRTPAWALASAAAQPPRTVRLTAPLALRSECGRKSLFAAPPPPPPQQQQLSDCEEGAAAVAPSTCSVEELALAHYAQQGWQGVHSEGRVWCTLFGLLFWDVLFDCDAVPGAFQSAFQSAPLDLFTPHFAAARAHVLQRRLASIAAGGAAQRLAAAWSTHQGTQAVGVHWRLLSLTQLQAIAACMGGARLEAVMRLLATDYTGWRGGMPDLVLWREDLGSAKLVEVKGVNDALRPGQRAWCDALSAAGVEVEVLQYE